MCDLYCPALDPIVHYKSRMVLQFLFTCLLVIFVSNKIQASPFQKVMSKSFLPITGMKMIYYILCNGLD